MSTWNPRVNAIFLKAVELASPGEQRAYANRACGEDVDLLARVGALLDAHEQAGGFLEAPATTPTVPPGPLPAEDTDSVVGPDPKFRGRAGAEVLSGCSHTEPAADVDPSLGFLDPPEEPGQLGRLGHYKVIEVIGRGGMGIVLRAFDAKLHRVVAIKAMAAPLAADATARQRFIREARAAAAVSHDHVVTIHAVEEARGLPYLVMQYISGLSLQERLDRSGPLELEEIVRIGAQTAAGLAAAHAQGLVHRDVKPANILLENGIERVKLTDFGLARAADDAGLSHLGFVAGTPQYMAPEQARGDPVDHRADLFSLGSVLYALCTGRHPFSASGTVAVLRRVCEESPRPIREINPGVPDWLIAIIETLHAKAPADRYQTAAEVAALLSQHLAHLQQPSTPPPTATPRRFPDPNPETGNRRWTTPIVALVALAGALGLTEATGITQLGDTAIRILTPEGTLVVEVNDPEVKVMIEGDGGTVITGAGPGEIRLRPGNYWLTATKDGRLVRTDLVTITRGGKEVVRVGLEPTVLARSVPQWRPPPPGPLDRLAPADIPAEERFPWQPKELVAVLGEHRGRQWTPTRSVALSPDGTLAASSGEDALICIWDAGSLRLRAVLPGHSAPVRSVAFSPDGRQLLSGGDDRTLRLWDLATGRELRRFEDHTYNVNSVAVSPDGRRALSGSSDGTVRLWDLQTGEATRCFEGHGSLVAGVAFSPDGTQALSGGHDRSMRLWEIETGRELRRFRGHTDKLSKVAFCPDGQRALSCGHDGTVRLWDVQTGEQLRRLDGHTGRVWFLAVTRDGRRALSTGDDRSIRLWNLDDGRELRRIQHASGISSVAVFPDGRRAISGGWDTALRLWDLDRGAEIEPLGSWSIADSWACKVAFTRDGRRVLTCQGERVARLWDVPSATPLRRFELPGTVWDAAFSPDDRHVLGAGGGLSLWDSDEGTELRRFDGASGFWSLALAPDGSRVLTGGVGDNAEKLRLWDVESGRELNRLIGHEDDVYSVAVSPDGRRGLSGAKDHTARLWDLASGHESYREQHPSAVFSVAVSPDGRRAASGDREGFVRLWDLTAPEPEVRPLPRWHTAVSSVTFSPDGTTLASCGWEGHILFWDAATGQMRRQWKLPGTVMGIAFAPDGRHLAAVNGNATTYILRLAGGGP